MIQKNKDTNFTMVKPKRYDKKSTVRLILLNNMPYIVNHN